MSVLCPKLRCGTGFLSSGLLWRLLTLPGIEAGEGGIYYAAGPRNTEKLLQAKTSKAWRVTALDTDSTPTTGSLPAAQFDSGQKQFVAARKVPKAEFQFAEMPARYQS